MKKKYLDVQFKILFFVFLVSSACSAGISETAAEMVPVSTFQAFSLTPIGPSLPINNNVVDSNLDYIQLAWFYKPPSNGDIQYLAEHYDVFILTKQDEAERDALVNNYGVESPILRYVLFDSIMDPGSCNEQPYRNQVADKIGDFCSISNEHPDWFLLDTQGNRIRKGDHVFMDPGNLEWQIFWLERVIQNQEALGWEGVFLDNVEAGFSKRRQLDQFPANYETPEAYQAAILSFLAYISDNYFKPQQIPLLANVLREDDPSGLLLYLPYLDGIMIEKFAVDWDDGYIDEDEWIDQMNLVKTVLHAGKHVILVAQGDSDDINRQRFAFASYQLLTNGNASFRYADSSQYDEINTYLNYSLLLGAPVTDTIQEGDMWVRYFEHGKVIVNPANPEAIIELD